VEQEAIKHLIDALSSIDPDSLSPREALQKIYELKQKLP